MHHERELGEWLGEQLGAPRPLALAAIEAVGGGCVNSAWGLRLADGRRFFLKSNAVEALPLLEAEAAGLEALARWAQPPIQVPKPLAVGVAALGAMGELALLLLPWLDLRTAGLGGSTPSWRAFGAALAQMHLASSLASGEASLGGQERFGWPSANFIGAMPQPNNWHAEWGVFFGECRLAPQIQWAHEKGYRLEGAERLLALVPELLLHPLRPALVHGDLWGGNAGLLRSGGAALFDPAVYWGDREVDLAMARLFGGFPPAFFTGYGEVWPLGADSGGRVDLYNLYHLLNHANLFGGAYWAQVEVSIKALLRARPLT